jgi:hypothetical protein
MGADRPHGDAGVLERDADRRSLVERLPTTDAARGLLRRKGDEP